MDEKFSESTSEGQFGSDPRESEGGETGRMEEGQGRSDTHSDKGLGQAVPTEMFQSVGPDELGKSLIVEELENVKQKQVITPFKSPPPEVVISEVFNLEELLENVDKCGRYRYIVVNATADKASVLIKTQNALFDVLKLCDAISLIVQNFQSGACNILEKLRVACLYLQDGFPDFAMADIESTSQDVAMMRERCGKTLDKVPVDDLLSMDNTVTKDLERRRSDLPEGFAWDEMLSFMAIPEEKSSAAAPSMTGQGIDSSKMQDRIISSDEMQSSLEAIQEFPNKIDQLGRLVDEEKARELKAMTGDIDDKLTKLPSDTQDETVYTSDGADGISLIYVPSVEKVLELISDDDESKCHYYPVAWMLKEINCVWTDLKDVYTILVYKYLAYREPLAATNTEPLAATNTEDDESRSSEKRILDPGALDRIDSYMRAKLTSVIVKIVKELYINIRKVIKDALDLTEKWYQECKTLVEPVMKFNLEKTQEMSKEEQDKFWQTCDPEFANRAEAYLERWRKLHEFCDVHRKGIKKLRGTIEGYYIDNPYPREAVKASWKLAAEEENEKRIGEVVDEWRSYMPAEVVGRILGRCV
ncbi:uncharacterized protein LOC135498199 [Lineus longissimus]|uniref:uncharacterized protein LOC135498199 n=1 Tax=Lineus longissimus TaxID=88925 RepID=UPI002B4E3CBC